ncbi:unnamed protein product [Adineta ricciae]|uniref:Uncharacterized protein n=1 Tax=Adineta ricciae TaxID=249248 RepID=A0A814J1B5_ADIRI|nr:unnamed protein product [Adineta ricciae]
MYFVLLPADMDWILQRCSEYIYFLRLALSYNRPKFYPNPIWHQHATTFSTAQTWKSSGEKIVKNSFNCLYSCWWRTGLPGNSAIMLNGPWGSFVNYNFDLYVVDCFNHRIQLFTLNRPTAVILDADSNSFIVGWSNHRIIGSDPNGFRCIVGCTGSPDSTSITFNSPISMSFDYMHGNIYVADKNNSRIQQFMLLNSTLNKSLFTRPASFPVHCLNEGEIVRLRDERLRQMQMWSVIHGIMLYVCCLSLAYVLIYSSRDSNAFYQVHHLRRYFLNPTQADLDYKNISTVGDLRAQQWCNGDRQLYAFERQNQSSLEDECDILIYVENISEIDSFKKLTKKETQAERDLQNRGECRCSVKHFSGKMDQLLIDLNQIYTDNK